MLRPYEAGISQGNLLLDDQTSQLEKGMTQAQVQFILGTPMLTASDSDAVWIYPTYSRETGYANLIVEFEEGLVSAIKEE